ncbi:hypothetical protein CN172_01060 [Sinorhizobium meliloti]|uniref:hypothetical protein n=1 Tax=Rhizobium meliloti TaxID=382 RepID=UPI000FDA8B5F|nr:hypothetical protein [Sinorhizobium meliloti]RVE99708.1 hypothetical protein CN232_16445 [Sinorhizobium meliloti]RVH42639.1 hypothetical protein CN208_17720 [Sinorhizobium meliloti]RVK21659.1 hypothetical protein CN172_01060 [Sinorhizobium meliloti]
MKFIKVLAVIAFASSCLDAARAEESAVHLFLNEDTAETKIDGLNVRLRAELTDKDLQERDFTRRPRVWITCYDGGRQIMTIDTADDLDPWPSVVDDRDISVKAKLTSQTGSFSDLSTQLRASRITHLMKISVDITGRAEEIARSWIQGFPIKLTASPGGDLNDLNLVIFSEARSSVFRTEAAALVRACEILAAR